jgi:hypothetical protein
VGDIGAVMKNIKDVLKQKPNDWLKLICKSFSIDFEEKYKKSQLVEILSTELSNKELFDWLYGFFSNEEINALKKCINDEEYDINDLIVFDAAGYICINWNNEKVIVSDVIAEFINNPPNEIDENIKLFYNYFKAFSNLYGIIDVDFAIELINEYEDKTYKKEDLVKYINLFNLHGLDFEMIEDLLIINSDVFMIDDDYYLQLMGEQEGKEYARLAKDEVLKYLDKEYYENTDQLKQMVAYFMYKLKIDKDDAVDLAENVAAMCKAHCHPDMIFEQLEDMGVNFYSKSDFEKFTSLYQELNNNVRSWENRGNTPNELRQRFEINK